MPSNRVAPKQQRSRETVERILDAADDLFAERGFHATQMTQIIDRSGVMAGSLYRFFPDKTSIGEALIDRYRSDLDEIVSQLPIVDTLEELLLLAEALVEFVANHQHENPGFRAVADAMDASIPGTGLYEIRQKQIDSVVAAVGAVADSLTIDEKRRMVAYLADIIAALLRTPAVDPNRERRVRDIKRIVRGYIIEVLAPRAV